MGRCRERAGSLNLPLQPTSEADRPETTQHSRKKLKDAKYTHTTPKLKKTAKLLLESSGHVCLTRRRHRTHIQSYTWLPLLGCWRWWPHSHSECYWSCCWGSLGPSLAHCCKQGLEHTHSMEIRFVSYIYLLLVLGLLHWQKGSGAAAMQNSLWVQTSIFYRVRIISI